MKKLAVVLIILVILFGILPVCFATNVEDTTKTNDSTEVIPKEVIDDTDDTDDIDDINDVDDSDTIVISDTLETKPVETEVNKENATRVWTISLAVVAILIVIGVCIYYMTNPKVNKK